MIVLLRHASAGDRGDWHGDDRDRPLDTRGYAQACALVERLRPLGVARVLSSPYARCVETVTPLADALAVDVETTEALAEGRSRKELVELVCEVGDGAVLCTHGDVVETLLRVGLRKGAAALLEPNDRANVRIIGSVAAP